MSADPPADALAPPPWTRVDAALLATALVVTLLVIAPDLAHPGIAAWDEVFHQLATRSTLDTPLRPYIFQEHLSPVPPTFWWQSSTWLHKSPLPYWLGGLVMRVIGVTPLALRLVSLGSVLATVALVFALARRWSDQWIAMLASTLFGALPFGWQLAQGVFFSDVHDCSLAFWNTLAVWALVRTLETGRARFAVAAGTSIGLGYLSKSVLALTPLGVALSLALARGLLVMLRRPGWGLRGSYAAVILMMGFAVAAPWDVYASKQFPDLHQVEYETTFKHIGSSHTLRGEVGPWARPPDGVFVELLGAEFGPVPQPTIVLGAIVLALMAVARRSPRLSTVGLWIWATLVVNSFMTVKVPAQVWGAAPGLAVALAVLVQAGFRHPWLGVATIGSLLSLTIAPSIPWSGIVAQQLPASWIQSHSHPAVPDSYALTALLSVTAYIVSRLVRATRAQVLAGAILAFAWVGMGGWLTTRLQQAHREQFDRYRTVMLSAPFRDLGRILESQTPTNVVLWLDSGANLPGQFNVHSLMFWSGRLTMGGRYDVPLSEQHKRVPILVSARPEPFETVARVPSSPFVAYDCRRPAAPPDMPSLPVHPGGDSGGGKSL